MFISLQDVKIIIFVIKIRHLETFDFIILHTLSEN